MEDDRLLVNVLGVAMGLSLTLSALGWSLNEVIFGALRSWALRIPGAIFCVLSILAFWRFGWAIGSLLLIASFLFLALIAHWVWARIFTIVRDAKLKETP